MRWKIFMPYSSSGRPSLPLLRAAASLPELMNHERGPMGLCLRPTTLADALVALADPKLTRSPDENRPADGAGWRHRFLSGTDGANSMARSHAAQHARHFRHRGVEGHQGRREPASRFGALATWADIRDARSAARVRRSQARGARGWRPAGAEPRHHRGQSLQRLAGGGRRAAAADVGCQCGDCQLAWATVGSAGGVHHGQSQDSPGGGRTGHGSPRSHARSGRTLDFSQAGRARLSRYFHRVCGGRRPCGG